MERVTESPARQRMVEVLSGRIAGSLADREEISLRGRGSELGYNFTAGNG
jgi:hypothetical protein